MRTRGVTTPYIGVTGFMSREEVFEVFNCFPNNPPYRLMVGVLASNKSLWRQKISKPNRYPDPLSIKDIFTNDSRSLNLIHYHTKNSDAIYSQLCELTQLGGENLHGFQLNITWPNPESLARYRRIFPSKIIVLQINRQCFETAHFQPNDLARTIEAYEGLVDYILIDGSGGEGIDLDLVQVSGFVNAIHNNTAFRNIGVAGGLSCESVKQLYVLKKLYPNISIDAEGKLRDAHDHLDLNKVKSYLQEANKLFNV